MTGFARKERQAAWGTLSCEIRSVNHRYLEPVIRTPETLRGLETVIRDLCRKQLQRGKVDVNLQLTVNMASSSDNMTVNKELMATLVRATEEVNQSIAQSMTKDEVAIAPVDPIRLLQWPGVIEQKGVDTDIIEAAAKELVSETLVALILHRQREGVELKTHIEQRLVSITEHVEKVREQMPNVRQAQQEKLQQRLYDLQVEVEDERLAQEVAILANKADVDEELDRLSTHVSEVKHILSQKGAIGRRLDFMMQELNREANTLSSKSVHTDTTQAAVSLKVLIEQMREQIQNIE